MKLLKSVIFTGLFILSTIFLTTNTYAIRIVQFNIQELDSVKIQSEKLTSQQMQSVKFILNQLKPDILSVNEIQYDLPGVPNEKFTSIGKNIDFFALEIFNNQLKNRIYFPANTGENALRNANGEYVRNPDILERNKYCDPVNFGMFPAQYSTAALTKFEVISVKQFNLIPWKEFNPSIDLSLYLDERGQPLSNNMPLFDKNFTDVTLLIQGHTVHLLLLHTVPAFGFGNPKTPNFARNRDQLLFLKWYLGHDTGLPVSNLTIERLTHQDSFIALGDWNVDITDENESANVLQSLGKLYHYAINQYIPTHRGQDLLQDDFVKQIDYILLSNDIDIKNSGVFTPSAQIEKIGCNDEIAIKEGFILVKIKNNNQICSYLVEENYYHSKMASDHLAVWADIDFKKS